MSGQMAAYRLAMIDVVIRTVIQNLRVAYHGYIY